MDLGAITKKLFGEKKVSKGEQRQIDAWIRGERLNQYGDRKDTIYAGGNPLFNESTGQTTDRYEHITGKHPDKPWKGYK